MTRKTLLFGLAVCAVAVACSNPAKTPMSPSATVGDSAALNPDGSSLKITAPGNLNPNGGSIDTRRPTLTYSNAIGRFASIGVSYDLEVQDAAGAVVYSRNALGESPGTSGHTIEGDLPLSTTLWWRVRARIGSDVGPWSGFAQFRTPDPPPAPVAPPPVGGTGLPFPLPAECGPFGPGNRIACAAAIAAQSVEWGGCAGGAGSRCGRFTRQVAYALGQFDPNWKMITAAPGGHSCNCSSCGPSDGTMFREDTIVYGGNTVYDIIVGAGGPAPSLNWTLVPGPRAGDIPADAPLCVP